jgi:flagellin-like protein
MKGVSAVIATILMLMIVIALAGTAYLYITGILSNPNYNATNTTTTIPVQKQPLSVDMNCTQLKTQLETLQDCGGNHCSWRQLNAVSIWVQYFGDLLDKLDAFEGM